MLLLIYPYLLSVACLIQRRGCHRPTDVNTRLRMSVSASECGAVR